jgi:hypothetical protein
VQRIGDVDSALIGRRPIAKSRFCSHSGEGTVLHALDPEAQAEAGQSDGVAPKSSVT